MFVMNMNYQYSQLCSQCVLTSAAIGHTIVNRVFYEAWFPYNRHGTGGSLQGRVRLQYLRIVPGTAGRVQSCLRYRWYRTVREKQSHESLMKWSSS